MGCGIRMGAGWVVVCGGGSWVNVGGCGDGGALEMQLHTQHRLAVGRQVDMGPIAVATWSQGVGAMCPTQVRSMEAGR